MKHLGLVLMVILFTTIFESCAERHTFSSGKWIDLTHDFSSETVYWPTADLFKLDEVFRGFTERGYYIIQITTVQQNMGVHTLMLPFILLKEKTVWI